MSYTPVDVIAAVDPLKTQDPVNGVAACAKVAEPDAAEVAKFESLMATPGVEDISLNKVLEGPDYKPDTNNIKTLGDAVLGGLDSLRQQRDVAYQKVADLAKASQDKGLSAEQMVVLQYEVFAMNTYQDLFARTGDKINQGVQTLFRNQ